MSKLIIGRESMSWGVGFHASELPKTYQHLSWILQTYSLGNSNRVDWFCEWGAGLGGVSACASVLGLKAFGFEVDSRLTTQARKLFKKYSMDIPLLEGSFLPEDAAVRRESHAFRSLETTAKSAWEQAPVSAEQVSLYYAYPWPGEESWIYQLFDQVASPGTLLFCFHGAGEYSLWRRVS